MDGAGWKRRKWLVWCVAGQSPYMQSGEMNKREKKMMMMKARKKKVKNMAAARFEPASLKSGQMRQ